MAVDRRLPIESLIESKTEGPLETVWGRPLAGLRRTVASQAEDESLWFVAATAPEAHLQAALRDLHRLVESL